MSHTNSLTILKSPPKLKYKKVLLTTAKKPELGTTALHFGDFRPPLGLGFIAKVLEQNGIEVKIVDNYVRPKNMSEIIQKFNPDLIGLYIHSPGYYMALDLIDELKNVSSAPLVVGGPHSSLLPETIPAKVDYIVKGEGEYVLLDLCKGIEHTRIIDNSVSGRIIDLNQLCFPDYKHFINEPYNWELDMYKVNAHPVFTMHTSRSCPYRCTFCGVASIWTRRYTYFSAERIVSEIDHLVENYGCQGIYFREDLFTTNRNRVHQMCDLLIKGNYNIVWACESRADITDEALIEKMYKSGCRGLYLGIESGADSSLNKKKKDLDTRTMRQFFKATKKVGLATYATFCMGTPGETDEEIQKSEEFILEVSPTVVDRFAYLGLPKSEDYETLLKTKDYYHIDSAGIIYTDRYYELAHKLYHSNDQRLYFLQQQRKFLEENKGKLSPKELASHRFAPLDPQVHKITSSTHNEYKAI